MLVGTCDSPFDMKSSLKGREIRPSPSSSQRAPTSNPVAVMLGGTRRVERELVLPRSGALPGTGLVTNPETDPKTWKINSEYSWMKWQLRRVLVPMIMHCSNKHDVSHYSF